MYQYGYIACMKTTINIDEKIINEAMNIYGIKTKTEIVEMGLNELINADKRKRLAGLFGRVRNIKKSPRRRSQ